MVRNCGCRILFASALALVAAGCGPSEPEMKPTLPVHGTLFVKGVPAKGAFVIFHPLPITPGRFEMIRSRGKVADDGTFQLTTYRNADGAPEGEYAVTLYWPGKRAGKADADEGAGDAPPDQLGQRFNNPATTALKATVKAGETNTFDFKLP